MRLAQLDGVRCVAICLVVGHHGFGVGGGWAGVDLFFVLSGLLITRILREARHEQYFWGPFYTRRASRIVPAFVLCPGLCALVLRGTLPRWEWPAYALFGANIVQAVHPYGGGPLGPLWSLAVEEHFYLLWPVAVRYLSRSKLMVLVVATLVLEPVLRAVATLHGASAWTVYYLTPFHLDGLAAGSLLALLVEDERTKRLIAGKSAITLAMLVATFAGCHLLMPAFRRPANSVSFNAMGYSLVALIFLALVSYVLLNERSLAARMLSAKPLVFLGTISYGLYLFHLVVRDGLKLAGRGRLMAGLALGLGVVFSWLSFKYFEQPILRWGRLVAGRKQALP